MAKDTKRKPEMKDTSSANGLAHYGVMPHMVLRRAEDGLSWQEFQRGWVIERTSATGEKTYCGEGAAFRRQPHVFFPFTSQQVAQAEADRMATEEAESDKHRVYQIGSALIEVPFAEVPMPATRARVGLHCMPREYWSIQAIKVALQRENVEDSDGRRIDSDAATLRWILNSIANYIGKEVQAT